MARIKILFAISVVCIVLAVIGSCYTHFTYDWTSFPRASGLPSYGMWMGCTTFNTRTNCIWYDDGQFDYIEDKIQVPLYLAIGFSFAAMFLAGFYLLFLLATLFASDQIGIYYRLPFVVSLIIALLDVTSCVIMQAWVTEILQHYYTNYDNNLDHDETDFDVGMSAIVGWISFGLYAFNVLMAFIVFVSKSSDKLPPQIVAYHRA